MKHSIASYSSSEDEGDDKERSPPTKKQRTNKKSRGSPTKEGKESKEAGPSLPAPHRKAYDWLPSSAAGASHHGPEGRNNLKDDDMVSDAGTDTPAPEKEAKPKKGGRKRAPDAPPGPGKNWRKGMRK